MRRCLALVTLLLVGCGHGEEKTTSKVVLPVGLKPPAGLKPDPPNPVGRAIVPTEGEPSLAGACRYGDEKLACWDAGGALSAPLTKSVRALLETRRTPLSMALGGRNRLVVIDLPKSEKDSTYGVDVDLGSGLQSVEGVSGSQRLPIVLEANATPKSIRIVRRHRLPTTVDIALRKGALARAEGGVVTVDAVERVQADDPMAFLLRGKAGWKIVFRKLEGGDLSFTPIDPYPDATGSGQRARFEPMTGKLVIAPPNAARITSVGTGKRDGSFVALIDVDPVKVRLLSLSVSRERTVTLTDIPMNPR